MKKLIDQKIYNTDTAEKLASWKSSHSRDDFHFCEEHLYKTKKGAYFIHGLGGALSKYARPSGNTGWCGGEDIETLTPEDAYNWLESHNLVEVAEKEFAGTVEEG